MSDELLSNINNNNNNDDNNDEPTAVATAADATSADGSTLNVVTATYTNVDYPSEGETENPIILELGTRINPSSTPTSASVDNNNGSISTSVYSTDYPLDMHLSQPQQQGQQEDVFATVNSEHQAISLLPTHLSLYNNPYTHHQQQHQHHSSMTDHSLSALHLSGYSSPHLPQTVCSWPPSTDGERQKTISDIGVVPIPMYISYVGAREHTIVKESNPTWKEKALQMEKDYKKTACDRERTRMRDMNRAFDLLRSKLPISKPNGKKYSKIESLRIAINYINHLQECLKDDPIELTETYANLKSGFGGSQRISAVDYIMDMDNRRRSETFHYEGRKRSYKDVDKELDESRSGTWSDNSYIPNGQDQWD